MNKILLFLDTETTGLNIEKAEIIQIAAIAYSNKEWAGTINLSTQPFSYDRISMEALSVNKITLDELKTFDDPVTSFKKFLHALTQIRNRISPDAKFIALAHNAAFDKKFVKKWWKDCSEACDIEVPEMNTLFFEEWVDTLVIARELHSRRILKSKNVKLETLADHYSIRFDGRGAHDALSDTKMLHSVYTKMESQAYDAINEGNTLRCKKLLESLNV